MIKALKLISIKYLLLFFLVAASALIIKYIYFSNTKQITITDLNKSYTLY